MKGAIQNIHDVVHAVEFFGCAAQPNRPVPSSVADVVFVLFDRKCHGHSLTCISIVSTDSYVERQVRPRAEIDIRISSSRAIPRSCKNSPPCIGNTGTGWGEDSRMPRKVSHVHAKVASLVKAIICSTADGGPRR